MATPFDPQRIVSRGEDLGNARKDPTEDGYKERTTPVVSSRPEPISAAGGLSSSQDGAGKEVHAYEDDSSYYQSVSYHDERKPPPTRDNNIKHLAKLDKERYPPFDSPLRSNPYRKNHHYDTQSFAASRTEPTFALNGYSFSQYTSENGEGVVEEDSPSHHTVEHFDAQIASSKIHNPTGPNQDQHQHAQHGSSLRSQPFRESSRIHRSVAFIDEAYPSPSFAGPVYEHSLLLESTAHLHVAGNSPGSSKYRSSQLNRRVDHPDGASGLPQSLQHKPISTITPTSREIPHVPSHYHRPKPPGPHSHYSPQRGIPHETHEETSQQHQPLPVSANEYPSQRWTDVPPRNETVDETKQQHQPTGDARSLPNPMPKSANFPFAEEPTDPHHQDTLPPPPVMPPIPSVAFGSAQRKVSSVTMNSPQTPRTYSSPTWQQSAYTNNDNEFAVPERSFDLRSMPDLPYRTENFVPEPENPNPQTTCGDLSGFVENKEPLTRVELDAALAECESFYESTRTVFDDEDVLREAIKARDIIKKITVAIATGNFPSAQELEERLEDMRRSSLTKSPEEKLRQIPMLKEIKKKLATERETRDSLSINSGAPTSQSPMSTDKRSVFISYTGQDQIAAMFAASLSSFLDKSGVVNFFDVSSLRIGELWETEIERSVADSHVFVSVLSPTYPFRKWCMNELDIALRNNKKVIPVCVGSEPYKLSEPFRWKFFKTHRAEGLPDHRIQQWEENLLHQSRIQAARNFSTNKNAFTELSDCVIDAIHANLQGHPQKSSSPTRSPQRSKPMVLSQLSKDVSNRISAQVPMPTAPAHTAPENASIGNVAQQNNHGEWMPASNAGGIQRESAVARTHCNMLAVHETRPVDPMGLLLTEKGDRAAAAAVRESDAGQSPPSSKAPQIDVHDADASVRAMLVSTVAVQQQPSPPPAVCDPVVCGPGPHLRGHEQTRKNSYWRRLRGVLPKIKKGTKPKGRSISSRVPSVVSQAEAQVAHDANQRELAAPPSHMRDYIPVPAILPNFKDQILTRHVRGPGERAQNDQDIALVTDAWAVNPRANNNDPKQNGTSKPHERDN